MARIARVVVPGLPHHIIQRGNRRQKVFFTDDDRKAYLDYLRIYAKAAGICFWAYCLMDNHFHLLFYQIEKGALSALMKSVMVAYSAYFNRK